MGWSYGIVEGREVGYGVEAICDHPDCEAVIDRGLAYCCGTMHGGEDGCGNYYCPDHRDTHPCEYKIEAEASAEHEAYIARGVCSQCGATSLQAASERCTPTQDPTGEYRCAGEDLWLHEEG